MLRWAYTNKPTMYISKEWQINLHLCKFLFYSVSADEEAGSTFTQYTCQHAYISTHCMLSCTGFVIVISSVDVIKKTRLEFRESDVSPAKTEVKPGKFFEFISPAKGYFKEK